MRIAPLAQPDDGSLDVVIIRELSRIRLLTHLPMIYRGTHLANPAVSHHRGSVVEADAPPGRVRLEVDGEGVGSLPARIELLTAAVGVLVPAA